jgi:hypothetical protein
MPDGLGSQAKMGIAANTDWTDVWAAVTALLPFESEAISQNINMLANDALEGTPGRVAPDLGVISVLGQTKHKLDYYNFATILEYWLGVNTAGVYTISDSFAKILRIAFEKGVSRWNIPAAMINVGTITGEAGQILSLDLDWIGRPYARSATAFPSLSITNRSRIRFSNSTTTSRIRIGDQADALGSGDEVCWSKFSLSLDRKLKGDIICNAYRYPNKPRIDGFREAKLTFEIPVYAVDTFNDFADAGTKLQSDLYFTDGAKTFLIEIPEIIITSIGDPIPGPGIITQPVECGCFINVSNTPMAAITNEFRITIT